MRENDFGKGYVSKAKICRAYRISHKTLRKWLHSMYFEELQAEGYEKNQQGLTPKQLQVLIDKVGNP